jgi:hypothetical protein
LITGLALDRDGLAQACMGVAAGDLNADGLLDLFVTNFQDESNTLYAQQPNGFFLDETRKAQLRDPSYAKLGFGTQALDGELDGHPDLVVANGHVYDLSHSGREYRMAPQYFRNRGDGAFVEVPASQLGPFFEGKYLGRGLARLDWNRDGLEDFAVSHMLAPAALVTNTTAAHGNYVALQLRGVASARDALGTVVELTAAGRKRVQQLTAGDGYEASNERQLVFGLGTAERVEHLRVRWPSGQSQEFTVPAVNSHYLLVEGRPRSCRLP